MPDSTPPPSRRAFLERVGAVGGTGALLLALDAWGFGIASAREIPPDLQGGPEGRRVLILGGGLAAMTAAYELGRRGYRVRILEARDQAGGRCQTARRGFTLHETGHAPQTCQFDEDLYFNHGPWRIPFCHRSTLYYCREFAVPLEVMVNGNDAAWAYFENIDGPLKGRRLRQYEIKADILGHSSELLAKSIHRGALEVPLSAEDVQKYLEFLRGFGHLGPDFSYQGFDWNSGRGYAPGRAPGAGLNPGEPLAPFDFATVVTSGLGRLFRSVRDYDQQLTMFQPVGGMDRLARAFEERLKDAIQTGAEVERLRQDDSGVTIDWRDRRSGQRHSERADYCLCTIPLPVLRRLDTDFPDPVKAALAQVIYAPTGKTGLQMSRRFWEEDDWIYGGHTETDVIGRISYPSHGWQGRKGILQGHYTFGRAAMQWGARPPEDRIAVALAGGEKVHPPYRDSFETGFSVAWHLLPEQLGGWAYWTDDTRRTAYPLLNRPIGRVWLAGEHLSYLTGWMAGAIESAWAQIEDLHRQTLRH